MPPNKPSSTRSEYDNGATEINVSQAYGIRKARGARNLLDPKKARSIAMAEWENIDHESEKKYKRMFARNEVPSKQEATSTKKKEISWADTTINTRKYVNGHSQKNSDEDADKSLVKSENKKQEDEIRQVTQTSVVYFSKSNYDGRVIMASSRREEEGKEKVKDKKLKCKRHHKLKEEEHERKECLDAALAAAAVRAVVEVSPQLSQQGLPRAYRVKTSRSHSHSFLVEPVWNEGTHSSDSNEPLPTERPQTAPEDTKQMTTKESSRPERRRHRSSVRTRTRSHSPPSQPLSSSVSCYAPYFNVAVPAPTSSAEVSVAAADVTSAATTTTATTATALTVSPAKLCPSRPITLPLPDEIMPPCNVSVNIQLVASTSNVSARAVLTDRAGGVREVPASVRWETQNKSSGYAVLDSLKVAKSLEHALAKAVMENAKSITSAISISNSEKGTTTTSSLENTARIALIEKSTCTTTEELSSEGVSEKETRVTTFVQERLLKSATEKSATVTVSPIPEEELTSSSIEMPKKNISVNAFEKGSLVSSVESVNPPNMPQKVSASSTGPYSSTDTNLGSKDKIESCISNRSSLENTDNNEERFKQEEPKIQIPPQNTQSEDAKDSPTTQDAGNNTSQKSEQSPRYAPNGDFQSNGTMSSHECLGKMRMEGWPQGKLENAWVSEVTRMVSDELKARAVRRLRLEEKPTGLRRAVLEERMPRDPMEQLVALQVRKVLGEMDKRGKRIPEEIVSEDRTSSEQLDDRVGQDADTSALETDTLVEQTELEHDESDRHRGVEVQMTMTEESSMSNNTTIIDKSRHSVAESGVVKQRSSSRSRDRRKTREKKQRKKIISQETEREIENTNFDLSWNVVADQWNNQQDMMQQPGEIDQLANINVGWEQENNQYIMEGQNGEDLQFMTQSEVDMSEITTADEQDMLINAINAGTAIAARMNHARSSEASNVVPFAAYAAYNMRTEASVESTDHAREIFPLPHNSMHSGPTTGSTGQRHEKKMDHSKGPNQYQPQAQKHPQKKNPVNASSRTPYHGHFSTSQSATSWPLAMTPFGPYSPFPQTWYPPQMNPFVPGAVPYPGMLPYRFMLPYRPVQESNSGSSTNNYVSKDQSELPASNVPSSENGNVGLAGCIPLNYTMTSNMHKQLTPMSDSDNASATDTVVENMRGQQYVTVQEAKVIPSSGLHTLYSKSEEMDTAETSKATDKPMGTVNTSGETLSRPAHLCDSYISTTSYTTQEEMITNNTGILELEVKEKAVSDLESSLVALLRKCSHALGRQAEQLAGALQDQQVHTLERFIDIDVTSEETTQSLQPVEHSSRSPVRATSPHPLRMRASEDPLELLRQMRIRQQERELSRARLPEQRLPLRRSKIVASCAKKQH